MLLTASATRTKVEATPEGLSWLAGVLAIELPPDRRPRRGSGSWQRPRASVVRFLRWEDWTFPTGLLGYVLAQAQEGGVPVQLVWDPSTAILPQVAEPTPAPNGRAGRPYQLALVAEAVAKGRGVVQAATGGGKTAIAALILKALGTPPSLLLVGSRALVGQQRTEIASWLGEEVGEFSAGRRILEPPTVVGLVQTIAAKAGEPWCREFLSTRRVLMLDECHHAAKSSTRSTETGRIKDGQWVELALACPAANRYGLSATPLKLDDPVQCWHLIGATGALFEASITSTALIAAGYCARPHISFLPFQTQALPARPDAKRTGGKPLYAWVRDEGIVNCYPRNAALVDAAQVFYQAGLKVLVVVEEVAHGHILEGMLAGAGIPVVMVHGDLDGPAQEERLEWLRREGARVVVSTRILGEGIDIPDLGAVVVGRGGKSFVKVFQNIGRGTRPKGEGGGACFVAIPDDTHHPILQRHVELMRSYLATEPGYRIAAPGQGLAEYVEAILAPTPT